MPQAKHSRLQLKLGSFINELLEPPQLGMAFPELRCTFAGYAIVPDISVIVWERIPVDEDGTIQNLIPFCPDWVIEILSPDQNQVKLVKNLDRLGPRLPNGVDRSSRRKGCFCLPCRATADSA